MRLLVVEDNASLLESIVQILRDEFEVDTAMNGEDGLFLALQNIYDAILLDVMMPEMDGFEVIQKIRDEKIETPVLFLTARRFFRRSSRKDWTLVEMIILLNRFRPLN